MRGLTLRLFTNGDKEHFCDPKGNPHKLDQKGAIVVNVSVVKFTAQIFHYYFCKTVFCSLVTIISVFT